jgi:hypothetical protein
LSDDGTGKVKKLLRGGFCWPFFETWPVTTRGYAVRVSLLPFRRKREGMSLSSLLAIIAIAAAFLAAAGMYFYRLSRGGDVTGSLTSRAFFAQRERRLALIERAHLDGGRKLLLVRRDDVEHLLLIGGPIDLIVETGIRPESLLEAGMAADDIPDNAPSYSERAEAWPRPEIALPSAKAPALEEPRLPPSLLPAGAKESREEPLELTPLQEAKAVL